MISPPGRRYPPARLRERREAATAAASTDPPTHLLGPSRGSMIAGESPTRTGLAASLRDNQHGLQTGPVRVTNGIGSPETHPFFYAGKEACA